TLNSVPQTPTIDSGTGHFSAVFDTRLLGASSLPPYTITYDYAGSPPNFTTAHASTSLTVNKATPTVSVTGGTFAYDGQPHPATGSPTGVFGESLGPLTLTYTPPGAGTQPVNPGPYAVLGSFAADSNYGAGSNTASIDITAAPTFSNLS